MKNSTAIVVLSACLGLFSSLPAYSNQNTPFDIEYANRLTYGRELFTTPNGFQQYVNGLNWKKNENFFGLDSCSTYGSVSGCTEGYVNQSDPLGTRVCELEYVNVIWETIEDKDKCIVDGGNKYDYDNNIIGRNCYQYDRLRDASRSPTVKYSTTRCKEK